MILTSFFKKRAPAADLQTALDSEAGLSGPVDTHPDTAPGGTTTISAVII
jgi:hypothetical protein